MEIKQQAAQIAELKKKQEAKEKEQSEAPKQDYYSQKLNAADIFVKKEAITTERNSKGVSLKKKPTGSSKAAAKSSRQTSLKSNNAKSFKAQNQEKSAQKNSTKVSKDKNVLAEMSRIKNDDNSDIGPSSGA